MACIGTCSGSAARRPLVTAERTRAETEQERRKRILREVIEEISRTSPGFSASDRLPREAIYDRDRARAEAKAAAERESRSPAESSDAT